MRLLHKFNQPKQAESFSSFLKKEGIDNRLEINANKDWGSDEYGNLECLIWVIDEDLVEASNKWLEEFQNNPNNPIFLEAAKKPNSPLVESLQNRVKEAPQKFNQVKVSLKSQNEKTLGPVTMGLLIACVLIFLFGQVTAPVVRYNPPSNIPLAPLLSPPINKILLYDYPQAWEQFDKVVKAYGIDSLQAPEDLPADGEILLQKSLKTPYWDGIYDVVVLKLIDPEKGWNGLEAPVFEKIREGEIWRAVTPILLHGNLLHIFFNMLWFILLGKIIEDKIGPIRYILLILFTAMVSNTAQYLMSGPNFVGISGVICGLLAFIWARQRKAAWEGYQLAPGVISFMSLFVFGMVGVQLIEFMFQVIWQVPFLPGIANTAHIVGGVSGYLLGSLNAFAMHNK